MQGWKWVAVANHAQSGESIKSALAARRFEKIFSLMKSADWLLVQFGHNDMKDRAPDALAPYRMNLTRVVAQTRAIGGTPVRITSMERKAGVNAPTLTSYPDAVRAVARKDSVALIGKVHQIKNADEPKTPAEIDSAGFLVWRLLDGCVAGGRMFAASGSKERVPLNVMKCGDRQIAVMSGQSGGNRLLLSLMNSASIKRPAEIGAMGFAAAFLIPRSGAFPNQFDARITFQPREGTRHIHGFNTGEVVPPTDDGVHPALGTQEIGVGMFVPHDAAGDGSHTLFAREGFLALYALHVSDRNRVVGRALMLSGSGAVKQDEKESRSARTCTQSNGEGGGRRGWRGGCRTRTRAGG